MDTEVSPKLFIGIDVHKRQWSVSIFTPNCHHKTFSQAPYPEALKSYLDKFFPKHQVICCYEACPPQEDQKQPKQRKNARK